MDFDRVISRLQTLASQNPSATEEKRGLPKGAALGVSTAALRKLAKELPKDKKLAEQLWRSSFHEAQLLAILVAPFNDVNADELNTWMDAWVVDIASWGICDQFAKKVAMSVTSVEQVARNWVRSEPLYVRRAGLALIANYCMKHEALTESQIDCFVELIQESATDDRQHVKQACCWALRELGKVYDHSHDLAVTVALELSESDDASSAWVGRCAYKELEILVKIPHRRRLISRNSKTARAFLSKNT